MGIPLGGLFFWPEDHWRHTQIFGVLWICIPMVISISADYGVFAAIGFAIALITGCWNLFFPSHEFGGMAQHLSAVGGRAVIQILIFGGILMARGLRGQRFDLVIQYVGLLNTTFIAVRGLLWGEWFGLLNAHTFDAGLIACCYPAIALRASVPIHKARHWYHLKPWLLFQVLAPPAVLLKTGGSTAWGAFGAALIAYFWAIRRFKTVVIAGTLSLLAAIWHQGDAAFDSVGRVEVWDYILTYLRHHADRVIFGYGSGSAEWMIPVIQNSFGMTTPKFLWAHNDWIQILLEQGFVGLFCATAFAIQIFRRAYKEPWLFATTAAVFVNMCTQAPMRYMPFQLVIICVLMLVRDLHGRNFERPKINSR